MSKSPKVKRSLRLEWIEAGTLNDNPANWRRHPREQLDGLKQAIHEIGWAGALLFNEQTGRLIDGHGRKAIVDPSTLVPVLVGSWSEEAERKILATLDPLGDLATPDAAQLESLLSGVELEGALACLKSADLPAGLPDFQPVSGDEQGRLDRKKPHKCPACGHEFVAA